MKGLVLLLVAVALINCEIYSVRMKGVVKCNGVPVQNVKIQLKESEVFFDDLLDETAPNERGMYQLEGHDNEMDGIEPYLLFFHNCPDRLGRMGDGELKFCIPQNAITQGIVPTKTFEIIIDLANQHAKEKC